MTCTFGLRRVLQLYTVDSGRRPCHATVVLHNCSTCTCARTYTAPNRWDSRSRSHTVSNCRRPVDVGRPIGLLCVDFPIVERSNRLAIQCWAVELGDAVALPRHSIGRRLRCE